MATFSTNQILSWAETTGAVDGGTAFQTRGAAPEGDASVAQEPRMSALYYADGLLERGWPLLDRTDDYSDVSVQATLESYARGLRDRESGAGTTAAYTIDVEASSWQPNQLGLPIKLRQRDLWHDTTTTKVVRPVGFKVTASEPGNSQVEKVELIFDGEAA